MGNKNSTVITYFNVYSVNYKKNTFEIVSNCDDAKMYPLDIFFDKDETVDKIKILKNNDTPFEIFGLNRVILSHKYQNLSDHNGDSRYINYIKEKINTQKKNFFILVWKKYTEKTDKIYRSLNLDIHYFKGKELKHFLVGMGSIASLKISYEDKKYTFLPTNMITLKYNKFVIYNDEEDLICSSTNRGMFEFYKSKTYGVIHYYHLKK